MPALRQFCCLLALSLSFVGMCQETAFSQDGTDPVVGVRVFWEVKLLTPSALKSAPQIITVLSPDGTVEKTHHVFEINHSTAPDTKRGGFQGQLWHGETPVKWSDPVKTGTSLGTAGETVSFVHSMALREATNADGTVSRTLAFSIENLASSTWGNLQTTGAVEAPSTLTSLATFDPQACLRESAILVGRNRIDYMKISRIELVRATGATAGRSVDLYLKAPRTTTP